MKYSKLVQNAIGLARERAISVIVYSYTVWGFTRYSYIEEVGFRYEYLKRPCTRLLLIVPSGKIVQ